MPKPKDQTDKNIFFDEKAAELHADHMEKRKRKKWRKLLTVLKIFAVILLLAIGGWIFEDIRWSRKLDQEVEKWRAAGLPTTIEDFNQPPTPEAQNAVPLYIEAFKEIQKDFLNYTFTSKLEKNIELMAEPMEKNKRCLKLLRKARSITNYHWDIKITKKGLDAEWPENFRDMRQLGRFLHYASLYYHHIGNDAAAVEIIDDIAAVANSTRNYFLLGILLSHGTDRYIYRTIESIAPNLNIQTTPPAPWNQQKHPVSRQAVESLIKTLLNEENIRKKFFACYASELFFTRATYKAHQRGEISLIITFEEPHIKKPNAVEKMMAVLYRPWHKAKVCQIHQEAMFRYKTGLKEDWRKTRKTKDVDSLAEIFEPQHYWDTALSAFGSANRILFRSLAKRRMAATALAIRLYEIDNGRRPTELSQLVPKYLPAVPKDPFSLDGKEISYLPNEPRPFLAITCCWQEIGGKDLSDVEQFFLNSPDDTDDAK